MIRAFVVALVAPALFAGALTAQDTLRPRVHVIATGGTISNMGADPRRTGDELVAGVDRIERIASVTTEQFSNVASGSITQEMLRDMARRIRDLSQEPDPPAGYIVTHGTDTMEETAFFLDLTVGGCAPVIVTGAMRQANAVGADGPANLLNSMRVAVSGEARGRGTMILMNDEIFLAREATKSNTTRPNAFSAPVAGPAGVADPDGIYFRTPAPSSCAPARVDIDKVESFPRVDIVYSYIGADSTMIDALVEAGARGLVVAGVGRGGTTPSQGRALRRAQERGVIIVVSNRTGAGRVGRGFNPESSRDTTAGRGVMMGAGDLNPQKARILLALALAAGMSPSEIAALMLSAQ